MPPLESASCRSLVSAFGRILIQKWFTLLFVPAGTLYLVVVFWQSQLTQYPHSTKGVLFMWLVAGLIFISLQLTLQLGAWREAQAKLEGLKLWEQCWNLMAQMILSVLTIIYNVVCLIELMKLDVWPTKPWDLIIGVILVVTLGVGLRRYHHQPTGPSARLLYCTGTKAIPQWCQGIWFAAVGSGGMHYTTLLAIMGLVSTRSMMAHEAVRHHTNPLTSAMYKASIRDFVSVGAMAAGWIIGQRFWEISTVYLAG